MIDWKGVASDKSAISDSGGRSLHPAVQPVSRPPLHTAITSRLRGLIVRLELRPGERINELDLAKSLQVSRTPLREALKVLQSEGLIVHNPNRGAYISHITPTETAELFEALAGVERLGGEYTAQRIGTRDLERFRALHQEMFAFHAADKRESYFELNDRIHGAFVELSGNTKLIDFHAQLIAGATRIRYAAIQYNKRWDESVAEHKAILAAIEARKAKQAGDIIERHVLETGALACDILERMDPKPSP